MQVPLSIIKTPEHVKRQCHTDENSMAAGRYSSLMTTMMHIQGTLLQNSKT
jgi:hypothetical protein